MSSALKLHQKTLAFASTVCLSVATLSVDTAEMDTSASAFALILAVRSRSHPSRFERLLIAPCVIPCAAHHGQAEVVLEDKTRADCITGTHAIEFDFGKKWAESLGQALYYSLQTGKRAGIVLILEEPKDRKYFIRLNSTIQHFGLPIDAWEVEGE